MSISGEPAVHHPPGNGNCNHKRNSHHLHERQHQFLQHACVFGTKYLLHRDAPDLLLHIVGTHRKKPQGRYQHGQQREDEDNLEHTAFVGKTVFNHFLNILGLEEPAGKHFCGNGFHPLFRGGVVAGGLYQQHPGIIVIRILPAIVNHRRALICLQRADLEIVIDTANSSRPILGSYEFRRRFINTYLLEGIFVEPPFIRLMIILLLFQPQNIKVFVVSLNLLERHPSAIRKFHRPVVSPAQRNSVALSYLLHAGLLPPLVQQRTDLPSLAESIIHDQNVLGVISQVCRYQVPDLQGHRQGAHQHHHGHHILEHDDHRAINRLCLESEGAPDNLYGLRLLDKQRRNDTGQNAKHDDEPQHQQDIYRCNRVKDRNLVLQHPGGSRGKRLRQQDGQQHRNAADGCAFRDHLEEDAPFLCPHQTTGSHLLGAEARKCRGHVDIVQHRKGQEQDAHRQQQVHETPVAELDSVRAVPISRFQEIHLPERDETHIVILAFVHPKILLQPVQDGIVLGLQICTGMRHHEADTAAGVAHLFIVGRIYLGHNFSPHQHIRGLQDGIAEVFIDTAYGNKRSACIIELDNLADGIFVPEMGIGKLFAYHAAVPGDAPIGFAALGEFITENLKKGTVSCHRVAVNQFAADGERIGRSHIRYTAALFNLREVVLEVLIQPITHRDALFTGYYIDPVGILLERIRGQLPLDIYCQQKHERHRHRKPHEVHPRIQFVLSKKVPKTLHNYILSFQILRFAQNDTTSPLIILRFPLSF